MNHIFKPAKIIVWGMTILLMVFGLSKIVQNMSAEVAVSAPEPAAETVGALAATETTENIQSTAVPPTPTPDLSFLISKLPSGVTLNWESLAEVDLNCDGQKELVYASRYSGTLGDDPGSTISFAYYSLDVVQEETSNHPAEGHILDYWYDAPYNGRFPSNIFFSLVTIDQCEHLIAFSGTLPDPDRPQYLQLFRWDGTTLKAMMNISETLVTPKDPLLDASIVMTTRRVGNYEPNKDACEWQYTNYTWDGTQLIVHNRTSKLGDCSGGIGG